MYNTQLSSKCQITHAVQLQSQDEEDAVVTWQYVNHQAGNKHDSEMKSLPNQSVTHPVNTGIVKPTLKYLTTLV